MLTTVRRLFRIWSSLTQYDFATCPPVPFCLMIHSHRVELSSKHSELVWCESHPREKESANAPATIGKSPHACMKNSEYDMEYVRTFADTIEMIVALTGADVQNEAGVD